ncbi:MAG: M20 family metallopeptidase [Rhodospirillaceae bacterium]
MTAAAASVIDRIDRDEVVALAAGLADIPSFSGGEADAASFVAERMRALGFDEVTLQEVEPGRPNAIGVLRGDGSGPSLMFNGHLDIDPIPSGYDRPLWRSAVEGDTLYGVGVGNMKAGDAAMILAAAAVRRAGVRLRGDIVVACVVGELQGGIGTTHLLDRGKLPDLAIVPEPTGLQIRTMHAGVLELLVTVHGAAVWIGQMHARKSVNAVEKALKAMRALHGLALTHTPHPELPGLPRLQVGSIRGGLTRDHHLWRPAFVPDCCTLAVDVRLHPGMTADGVLADLRRCLDGLAAEDPDFRYEIEPPPAAYRAPWRAMALYMPPLELPKDHPLVGVVARHHAAVVGAPPQVGMHVPGSHAGADSGHLWSRGVPCFNYGPSQHSRFYNEVPVPRLVHAAQVLAATAAELCGQTRDSLGFDRSWRKPT